MTMSSPAEGFNINTQSSTCQPEAQHTVSFKPKPLISKQSHHEKNDEKDARAKLVLGKAKERITRLENENKKLKAQLETFSPSISGISGSGVSDETPRHSVSPTLKRARDSTSGSNEEEDCYGPSGQQKKPKSEGQ